MINKYPHKLTYWKNGGLDRHNQPTWDGPYVVDCRWEFKERLFYTEDGQQVRGNSTIYLKTNLLNQGDYVYRGESTSSSPESKSYEIKRNFDISNIRGTRTEYSYIA